MDLIIGILVMLLINPATYIALGVGSFLYVIRPVESIKLFKFFGYIIGTIMGIYLWTTVTLPFLKGLFQ